MANPTIGEVPCPMCQGKCAVKKFATRATTDAGRRQAGRMYFDCTEHGRFGFDGKPAMQDYILTKGTIWPGEKPAAAGAAPASAPSAEKPAPPAPKPAAPAPHPERSAAKPEPEKPAPKKSLRFPTILDL